MRTVLDAVAEVLARAGEPLHYREIARRILDEHLWRTDGKTPEATVNASLTVHIKTQGEAARFRALGSGLYTLSDSLPPPPGPSPPAPPPPETLSFTEAAERVLTQNGDTTPLHYREITARALAMGLIATSGRTPEATMYGSILQEIQRYQKRGEQPRFHMHGKGIVGLSAWMPIGIPSQIDEHNRETRQRKQNVQAPVVQQVRGSLSTHEQGLIITTSDFSVGARDEAARADAVPVGLMSGQQLINLLLEHEIGVQKTSYDLFELSEDGSH